MNRVPLKHIPVRSAPLAGWAPKVHRVLLALFLTQWALVWFGLWLPRPLFGSARWPNGLLVVLATATLLAGLCRQLPGQNVMLASLIIVFLAGAITALGALTAIPFGPLVYTDEMGPQLFGAVPWVMSLIWIVVLLASRGVARLVLRPWRNTPNYGFWLIGLTALLVVLLDLGLEPFAIRVAHLWQWNPTRIRLDWYTTPCVNFLGWAVTALLILAFITPALISKNPMQQPPRDYHPLIVWLVLNLLFATGAAAHRLWPAAVLTALVSGVVAALALASVWGMTRKTWNSGVL